MSIHDEQRGRSRQRPIASMLLGITGAFLLLASVACNVLDVPGDVRPRFDVCAVVLIVVGCLVVVLASAGGVQDDVAVNDSQRSHAASRSLRLGIAGATLVLAAVAWLFGAAWYWMRKYDQSAPLSLGFERALDWCSTRNPHFMPHTSVIVVMLVTGMAIALCAVVSGHVARWHAWQTGAVRNLRHAAIGLTLGYITVGPALLALGPILIHVVHAKVLVFWFYGSAVAILILTAGNSTTRQIGRATIVSVVLSFGAMLFAGTTTFLTIVSWSKLIGSQYYFSVGFHTQVANCVTPLLALAAIAAGVLAIVRIRKAHATLQGTWIAGMSIVVACLGVCVLAVVPTLVHIGKTKTSPRMVGYIFAHEIFIEGTICAVLVYLALIFGSIRLPRRTRIWLIAGYATMHIVSWGTMHCLARHKYRAEMVVRWKEALPSLEHSINEYKHKTIPKQEQTVKTLQAVTNAPMTRSNLACLVQASNCLRYRRWELASLEQDVRQPLHTPVYSVAPVPFVLVSLRPFTSQRQRTSYGDFTSYAHWYIIIELFPGYWAAAQRNGHTSILGVW